MRQHERTQIVAKARGEISLAVSKIASEHDLTYSELFSILGGEIQGFAKYAIRDERHPGSDTPGDVACDSDCTHPVVSK